MPPIGPSSELTHAGRPYELTLLVSTVLVGAIMLSFAVIPSTVHLNIICDLLTSLSESPQHSSLLAAYM